MADQYDVIVLGSAVVPELFAPNVDPVGQVVKVRGRRFTVIGVLNNTKILGEWPEDKGQASYDHIVPVFGIGSGSPMKDSGYHPSDSITISDNGLHNIGPNVPYLYTYEFATFPRTRAQANAIGGPVYALRDRPRNYGTAVSGVLDPDGVTIPVRLTSDADGEGVQNGNGPNQVMKRPPAAAPIKTERSAKLVKIRRRSPPITFKMAAS